MSERFPPLEPANASAAQRKVMETLLAGPRKGMPGPFHALLRSPELADRVRHLGDFIRFGSSVPAHLNELAILLVAKFWRAQFEWWAHRRLSIEAGLDASIADAIEAGRRPDKMTADEALVYDFCTELLTAKDVSDRTYAAAVARFGETTVLDLIGTAGYYGLVSLVLNTARVPIPEGATPLR